MKKNAIKNMITVVAVGLSTLGYSQSWETVATDASGDGASGGLLDGTELEYWYNQDEDSLWFLISCASIGAGPSSDLGFNIMVNYPGGGSTFNFWGSDNTNAYHRLVTGWVTGSPPSSYSGVIGIANSAGVSGGSYTNLFSNNLTIIVNTSESTIQVGMDRSDLIPDAALNVSIDVAAAVGSSSFWNDDIYSPSGTMTLVNTASIEVSKAPLSFEVYPNPTNGFINILCQDKPNDNREAFISDISGKVVSTTQNLEGEIDIQHLPKGMYFVHVVSGNGTEVGVQKFIKN